MTIKVLNPFEPTWWTPTGEVGQETPTRFKLKGLDGETMGYIAPEFVVDDHGRVKNLTGKGIELALSYGLVDWENLINDKGPVRFGRFIFRLLPYDLRAELATQILILSEPADAERKN